MENAENKAETLAKDCELDMYVKLLFANNAAMKRLEENQKKLKEAIISKMDMLKTKRYSVSSSEKTDTEENSPITVALVENTSCTFDVEKIKEIAPQAIENTLTVDKSNMEEFKFLLKSYDLSGKQVNKLVKVMKVNKTVNAKTIENLHDKGEITAEQLSGATTVNVTSRYIKFVKLK